MHCAPAHGSDDYAAFRSLGLLQGQHPKLICHVNGEGRFSEEILDIIGEEHGKRLSGLAVLSEGTDAVIELLQEMDGVLLKEEKIKHRYPYDWKTDKPIIVTYVAAKRQFTVPNKSLAQRHLPVVRKPRVH